MLITATSISPFSMPRQVPHSTRLMRRSLFSSQDLRKGIRQCSMALRERMMKSISRRVTYLHNTTARHHPRDQVQACTETVTNCISPKGGDLKLYFHKDLGMRPLKLLFKLCKSIPYTITMLFRIFQTVGFKGKRYRAQRIF